MKKNSLSDRGIKAATTVIRTDMEAYFDAVQNLYHRDNNPNGAFPLNVAENKLSWHLLKAKIQDITRKKEIPEWVSSYTSGKGSPSFREAVAKFLSRFLTKSDVNPEQLAFSAGATSVIEMTALVLGDIGDVAAFPAPCYPVYKQDIGNIAGMERYDIITHHELSAIKDGLLLNISDLEKAKKDIEKQGKKFRMLVLTNPDNPTGGMYKTEQLLKITNWCEDQKIHLIVNEIYGLSLINTTHPSIKHDYTVDINFASFLDIMAVKKSQYLHWWYSFSKDFGISGFRVGAVYSHNEKMITAYENLNYSHLVSNYTQWILEEILNDTAFIASYISQNQALLTEAYITVVQVLQKLKIDYVPSRGSLFIWIDLSRFLKEDSIEAQHDFWLELYEKTGILLTSGDGFGHTKKGLFRMVYPYFNRRDLEVMMDRFANYIVS